MNHSKTKSSPRQGDASRFHETTSAKFFADAGEWIVKVAQTGKPPGAAPTVPAYLDGKFFDFGRGIFKSLFTALEKPMDAEDASDIIYEHALLIGLYSKEYDAGPFCEKLANAKLPTYSHDEVCDFMDEDESYWNEVEKRWPHDDNFDGAVSDFLDEIHSSGVATASDDKAEKPKKAVDKFAKLYDWISKLPMSQARRAVVAQLVRHTCGRSFTWASNRTLADELNIEPRQVQKQLRAIEKAGIITIRKYTKSWCKTQRLIFVNKLAENDGVDPQIELPLTYGGLMQKTSKRDPAKAQKKDETAIASIQSGMSDIGCPVGHTGDVLQDTRRDKGFSLPKGREKNHTAKTKPPQPPKGRAFGLAVDESQSQSRSECEAVKESKVSTARPPMDWAEKNLPQVGAESHLAKKVRQGQISHVHPDWLSGRGCWMVRIINGDNGRMYAPAKLTRDGWFTNTCDAAIVPLIDSKNRRIKQSEFIYQLMTTGIKEPDKTEPLSE